MSTWIQHFAMDVTRMTRLVHWKLYTLAENYPEYMDRYSITMERLKMAIPWNASSIWNEDLIWFDRSELLCHQLLLKYKWDRESCWLRLEAGCTPCWSLARYSTGTIKGSMQNFIFAMGQCLPFCPFPPGSIYCNTFVLSLYSGCDWGRLSYYSIGHSEFLITIDMLDQTVVGWEWCCVLYNFSSIPGLSPQHASSIFLLPSCDNQEFL